MSLILKMAQMHSSWQRIPTDNDVSNSEQALARVQKDLADRRADQRRRESSQTSPEGGWLSKVAVNFRGGSGWYIRGVTSRELTRESESSTLAQELQGLEALEYQMSKDLETLRGRQENARFATTLRGRVFAIMGHGFAIYCVFRIISVSANTLTDECISSITRRSLS